MNKKQIVGIYCRVSSRDQNIETQQRTIKEYCDRNNIEIAKEYLDIGFSGKTDSRPQFDRLMEDMRSGLINCIVTYKLDRIGRSMQHLINLFSEFKNRGVEFISLSQNIDTTTPEGRMFLKMLMVLAEYEREIIVQRTNEGLHRAKAQGKVLGRPKGKKDSIKRRRGGYFRRWERSDKHLVAFASA